LSEWVAGDWTKVKVGQTVQLRHPVLVGALTAQVQKVDIYPGGGYVLLGRTSFYPDQGWQLFVEAPEPEPLPTVPGIVIRYDDELDVWVLDVNLWMRATDGYEMEVSEMRAAPFTILEPRTVTAKAVLDAIGALIYPLETRSQLDHVEGVLAEVAADFGVSDV
jgi:hypothetical protein